MADMGKCDPDVFERGEAVLMIHLGAEAMEAWVLLVRADLAKRTNEKTNGASCSASDTKVDWSYMGGRAIVKALGDDWAAFRSMRRHLPELLTAQKAAESGRNIDLYEGPSYTFLGEFCRWMNH